MKKVKYIYVSRDGNRLGWYRAWQKKPKYSKTTTEWWGGDRIDIWCPDVFHKFAFELELKTVVRLKVTQFKVGFKWGKC